MRCTWYAVRPIANALGARVTRGPGLCSQIAPVPCEVTGTLPTWLKGYLVTNGPGTQKGMKHFFSGYGMIRKLSFDGQGGAVF